MQFCKLDCFYHIIYVPRVGGNCLDSSIIFSFRSRISGIVSQGDWTQTNK